MGRSRFRFIFIWLPLSSLLIPGKHTPGAFTYLKFITDCVHTNLAVTNKIVRYADTTFHQNIYNTYNIFIFGFWQVFSLSSTLLVVLMSVDRLIAVKYPLRASTMCTLRRAYISTAIMIAIILVYSIPHFIYSRVGTCIILQNQIKNYSQNVKLVV